MTPRELSIAKIVFWCVSPIMFAGLVRLFFLFFYFIFGMKYNPVVFWLSVLAAVGFTAAALVILYRMFKIHVLEQR